MAEHDHHEADTGGAADRARVTDALVALEVNSRLLVHAWAALEVGNTSRLQELLAVMADRASGFVDKLVDGDAQRETVRLEARDEVRAVIGW